MKKLQKPILDKEAMIKWLGEVIDAEMDKPDDEIDMALVMECDGYLAELMSDIEISDEQIEQNIASIMKKPSNEKITSAAPRRTNIRRRLIAALCAVAMIIGGTVSAYAFVPAFRDVVRNVLNLDAGSAIEDNGVTFINFGETYEYSSIDELIQSEKLGILYPHNLPDKLKIRFVSGAGEGEELVYSISLTDNVASITIRAVEQDVSKLIDCTEVFESSHNIISYISQEDDIYLSTTVYNGWTYYVTSDSMENLILILENLY